jgi:hypothetical protein
MRNLLHVLFTVVLCAPVAAQTKSPHTVGPKTVFEGKPATIRLAPHVTTTIRLPEPINSVVVGDPSMFQAEYSINESLFVFTRPTGSDPAQTDLVISTVRGRQFILLLRSRGVTPDEMESQVDLLVLCGASGPNFIEETFPSAVVSETVNVSSVTNSSAIPTANGFTTVGAIPDISLDEILDRQRHVRNVKLYGDHIRVGVGQVIESGSRLMVPFSVMNSKSDPMALVPPQVQLAGQSKSSSLHRSRWETVQQIPVETYQWTSRELKGGERTDGVVVFQRPGVKQSTEGLFLQIADSAAIDQPTLAPINFRQTSLKEKNRDE